MNRTLKVGILVAGSAAVFTTAVLLFCFRDFFFHRDKSTNTSSAQFSTLAEKISFFKIYGHLPTAVRALEYQVVYHDNGWAPSDAEIQLVAKVQREDLAAWVGGRERILSPVKLPWVTAYGEQNPALMVSGHPIVYHFRQDSCSYVAVYEKEFVVAVFSTTMGCASGDVLPQ